MGSGDLGELRLGPLLHRSGFGVHPRAGAQAPPTPTTSLVAARPRRGQIRGRPPGRDLARGGDGGEPGRMGGKARESSNPSLRFRNAQGGPPHAPSNVLVEPRNCGAPPRRQCRTRAAQALPARSPPWVSFQAEEGAAASACEEASLNLRQRIGKAKAETWQELLDSVNGDPWGRPYKMVMGKLKQWAPPFTESMDSPQRDRILASLFPTETQLPPG